MLLDSSGRPWLVEVNRSPSFSTHARVDAAVKEALIEDTLRLVWRGFALQYKIYQEVGREHMQVTGIVTGCRHWENDIHLKIDKRSEMWCNT